MGTRRSKHNKGRKPLYKEHRGASDPWDKRAFLHDDASRLTAVSPTATTAPPPLLCRAEQESSSIKKRRHRLSDVERAEIIRLRVEERLGSPAIAARLNTNTTSVCVLLKSYPLTADEHRKWRAKNAIAMRAALKAKGNYSGGGEWTAQERRILERLWPTAPRIKVEKSLPGRTWATIGKMAHTRGMSRSRSASNKTRHIDPLFTELREIREAQQMTRDELGERIGYHRGMIATWELGYHVPKWPAVRAWIEGLECSLRVLRNGEP